MRLKSPPRSPAGDGAGALRFRAARLTNSRQIWDAVADRVCAFTHVTRTALEAGGHAAACVSHARMLACYIATVELGLSHRELERVGPFDQPTIDNACRRIEERREDTVLDTVIDLMVDGLKIQLAIAAPPASDAGNDNNRALAAH